jgi:hypothetical protein
MRAGCGGVLGVLAVLLVAPAVGQAQTREPRVFVTVGGGVQNAGNALTDRLEWEVHLENATADIDYGTKSSTWFGGGAGVRLWRQLGAGIAYSSASRDGVAQVEAQIPHPFFFERPRAISGESASLSRSEAAIHAHALYIVPARGRLRIILSAGPSRFEVEQDIVTDVRFTEEFPFDEAAFQRADSRGISSTAIGFNVGADVAFMFTRVAGIAGLIRFSQATVDLARPDGAEVSVKAGGVQAGVGFRLAF